MEFADRVRAVLVENIGQERFELWFGGAELQCIGDTLRVSVSSSFQADRVRKVFLHEIKQAMSIAEISHCSIEVVVGSPTAVATVAHGGPSHIGGSSSRDESPVATESAHVVSPALRVRRDSDKLADDQADLHPTGCHVATPCATPKLLAPSARQRGRQFRSFQTFVEGDCNQLARASVDMVMQRPGEITPLLVHGPTGVGKSHLVESVWTKMRKQDRRARVVYLTAEQFTTYFLDALKGHGLPNFRRRYRQADLLIIDDIQFLAGKQATITELVYTIDELAQHGKQLILTADRSPAQLGALGREVGNRLHGGLVCGMQPIGQATMEILSRNWAAERRIVMDDSVHSIVASRMRGDARQLSGVLNRLLATSLAKGEPITARIASEVIHELVPGPARIIRLQDIRRLVCELFGIESEHLQRDSRSPAITHPRMLAMWLARQHTAAGLHEISSFFGRRSHSSAAAAAKKVEAWMQAGTRLTLHGQPCDIRDVIGQIEDRLRSA